MPDLFEGLGQVDERAAEASRRRRAGRAEDAHQDVRSTPHGLEPGVLQIFPELGQAQPGFVEIPVERGGVHCVDACLNALRRQKSGSVGVHRGLPVGGASDFNQPERQGNPLALLVFVGQG